MKNYLIISAFLGLAACSGGSGTGGSVTLSPRTVVIEVPDGSAGLSGTVPSGGGAGSFQISGSGGPITITHNALLSALSANASYGAADLSLGNVFEVVAFSDDGFSSGGQSIAISTDVIGSSTASTAGFGQYARFQRTGTTLMPVSGSGTYTGEYRATYGSPGTGIIAVIGDASLGVNFGSASITGGSITNRTSRLPDGTSFESFNPITLNPATISGAGLFSGTITGGLNTVQTLTLDPLQSGYTGMIGGLNGLSAAGAITIYSVDGASNTFTELGVFTVVN